MEIQERWDRVFPTHSQPLRKLNSSKLFLKALKQQLKNPTGSFPPRHIWECIYFISREKKEKFQDVNEKPRKGGGKRKKKEGRGKERKQI